VPVVEQKSGAVLLWGYRVTLAAMRDFQVAKQDLEA